MLPITVCIIGKNEKNNIEKCLQSLLPYGFEIQYTDTGSEDETCLLVSQYPVHITKFDWCDDFSAARNFNISQSTNDWILCIDCDEILLQLDVDCLVAFMTNAPTTLGKVKRQNHYIQNGASQQSTEHIGRFFNRTYYTYEGLVHEQVVPLFTGEAKTAIVPITLEHFGYHGEASLLRAKADRNIALLHQQLAISKPNPYLYFQLGQSCFMVEDYDKALRYFEQGLAFDVEPAADYVQLMVESYGYSLLYTQQYKRALQFTQIYDAFSFHADFVFLMGLIYMYNCEFERAIQELKKATTLSAYSTEGVNSYLAYYNIGVIYECQNAPASAANYYHLAAQLNYAPASERLRLL